MDKEKKRKKTRMKINTMDENQLYHTLFHKTEEEGILSNIFCKTSTTLTPKPQTNNHWYVYFTKHTQKL